MSKPDFFRNIGVVILGAAVGVVALATFVFFSSAGQKGRTGRVEGLVLDEARQPLADAVLGIDATTATEPYPEIAPISNEKGQFNFSELPPGRYTLRASLSGYQSQTQTVEVRAGETAQVEFVMKKPDSR